MNRFIWGTATAAYQIEGATAADDKGPSIWDTFAKNSTAIVGGIGADIACDHYNRYREDVGILSQAGIPNYRFSISWTRLFPEGTGKFNQKGADFYSRLIDALLEKGITPWATLYHWDLPQALEEKGGWTNRDIMNWVGDYAEQAMKAYGDRIKNWMILNEPPVTAFLGHYLGWHAPGRKSLNDYLACVHHQNMTIGSVYRRMKALDAKSTVGSTFVLMPVRPQDATTPASTVETMDCVWNHNHFQPIFTGAYPDIFKNRFATVIRAGDENILKTDLDFVGLQHYSPLYAQKDANDLGIMFGKAPESVEKNSLGWEVSPDAFEKVLLDFTARYKPKRLMITENGMALHETAQSGTLVDDQPRISYLQRYIAAMQRAIAKGAPIDGYFVWSLLDNFEWAEGFGPRFGLVYVDYEQGQKRIPKSSLHWYGNFIQAQRKAAA
jgi:beta-glucosidase